ncbi:MAG: hypothetical protein AAF502_15640 [Bacteroidota bacterium]
MVVGGYLLAGLAKLKNTGSSWIYHPEEMALSVMKGAQFRYADTCDIAHIESGECISCLVMNNTSLFSIALGITLLMESTCFFALFGKKPVFFIGICLLTIHLGIYLILDIILWAVAVPVLIFTVNPIYIIYIQNRLNSIEKYLIEIAGFINSHSIIT